ncbi:MAG: Tol-Pal system beta propeller repeat protein TolB, partial [Desulfobacterales bacterium]|nr:Tol-Pal system beta propeller repeat protein TolB [Desulfobacterales bacterium]
MKKSFRVFFKMSACAWILVLAASCPASAADYDYINISEPFSQKVPIAVPVFQSMSVAPEEAQLAREAAGQLAEALAYTGYFKLIDHGAFLEQPAEKGVTMEALNFKNWRDIGAELLITGGVRY